MKRMIATTVGSPIPPFTFARPLDGLGGFAVGEPVGDDVGYDGRRRRFNLIRR